MKVFKTAKGKSLQVAIKEIDDRPGPYCMSFGFDLHPLMESIKRVGMIHSPLLIRNEDKGLDIISGYRRIHALKSLGWDKAPCRIISPAELSPLECLLLNFHDNLFTRQFNAVEKGMALGRLLLWIQRNEILKDYMPLLELPSHEPTLDFYLRLDKEPEEEIKKSIAKGDLSLSAAKLILELDNDVKSSIVDLISNLKFNINQQKQLIEYLYDISYENKSPIEDILKEEPFVEICSNTRMNNPQKVNSLLKILRARIFPRLTRAEEAFKRMISGLDLPEGTRILYPPFFEAPNYRMEVQFKDGKELRKKIAVLSRTKGLSKLHDPWERDS